MYGIISGNFDPFHNGHVWLIEEMRSIFDKVYILIGNNPNKTRCFTQNESLQMILSKYEESQSIWCDIIRDNMVDYIKRRFLHSSVDDPMRSEEITIVRGIRSAEDVEYELNITGAIRSYLTNEENGYVHHLYIPARQDSHVSSSLIRAWAIQNEWGIVGKYVPPFVLDELKRKFDKDGHSLQQLVPLKNPEDLVYGFGPSDSMDSVYGFGPPLFDPIYGFGPLVKVRDNDFQQKGDDISIMQCAVDDLKSCNFGKMPDHYELMIDNGLINYSKVINSNQVQGMLDEFPVDVIVSKDFYLKTIDIDTVLPTGERYLPESQSLGPIIVDKNKELPQIESAAIVIEGKHRWLDAKARGEKTILAWVGEEALPYVKG